MNTDYESLILDLNSEEPKRIVSALRTLKIDKDGSIPSEVIVAAMPFMNSKDEIIRHDAIFALGLHLAAKEVFDELLSILQDSYRSIEDRVISARSLEGYRLDGDPYVYRAMKVLVGIINDADLDADLRGVSYMAARSLSGDITLSDRQISEDSIDEMSVDYEWLERCKKKYYG